MMNEEMELLMIDLRRENDSGEDLEVMDTMTGSGLILFERNEELRKEANCRTVSFVLQ